MSVEVQVHSTAKRAACIVAFALTLSALFIGAKKLTGNSDQTHGPTQSTTASLSVSDALMMPIVLLPVDDASRETNWSASLAQFLSGTTEAPVANGRVDVLTEIYAIEVDKLDKWHEGIGQAAHYGGETGKQPCLALIVESDLWPLNTATTGKLRVIEKTALAQGIKLVVLRRKN